MPDDGSLNSFYLFFLHRKSSVPRGLDDLLYGPGPLDSVLAQSREYPLQIAFRQADVGWRYLDEARLYDRVNVNVMGFVRFANNLPVYLAACRYVDRDVTLDFCMAAESSTAVGTVAGQELLLDLSWRRQVFCTRHDVVFRELSLGYVDLAAPAHRTSTTDGVDIDTQAARRLQHRRPCWESTALAGRRKHDNRILSGCRCHFGRPRYPCPARRRRRP